MFKSEIRVAKCLGVTLLLFALAGCGRSEVELGSVSGRVTLDGQPLRGVFIVFQPDNRKPALALLDSDGKFTLRYNVKHVGTVVGKQGIYLKKPLSDQLDEVRQAGIDEPSPFPKKFEQIFETVDVKSGRNHFNLELKSS
ncbi:hypothetical protein [Schlesneria paludicola]|uniref:hypothetical protein n=1 Tax=Schlesneria paludicola TaxID=360056 RepID=UPI0002D937C9|nr:hypothetical protein [Schlesneria paludicola]